jgi:CRISPR-associated protein Csd1
MILHSLKEYYDRLSEELAPEGFERKCLEYLIIINRKGEFIDIEDTREKVGKRLMGKTFELPRSISRSGSSSYKTTFLLWDHIGYVLGMPFEDKLSEKQHETWLATLHSLPLELKSDEGVTAILLFYSSGEFRKAIDSPKIKECIKSKPCNMSFQLDIDQFCIIPCRKAVKNYVVKKLKYSSSNDAGNDINCKMGVCLISGNRGTIVRTHSKTFISKDANSLVCFQKKSGYDSYRKEQGYNAPVIKSTEFAYITSLNTLLKSQTQKLMIGKTVTIFWSQKKTQFETIFAWFFNEVEKDDPSDNVLIVESLLKSPQSGEFIQDPPDIKFFILGLAQGGGHRICVRFWKAGPIADFARNIRQHFLDLELKKPAFEPRFYTINQLLKYSSPLDDKDRIPPNIEGDIMRSIMDGTLYPLTLFQQVLRRIKSDGPPKESKSDRWGANKSVRIALVKAFLNRYIRKNNPTKKEFIMELDTEQNSVAYRLGRIFAVLERIQEKANPKINTTIRERYYGAACCTPLTVFPTLLRLKNHHIKKLDNKWEVGFFERLIGETIKPPNNSIKPIYEFPPHLTLHEQGEFAIGYYHQRQDLFTSKKEKASIEVVK